MSPKQVKITPGLVGDRDAVVDAAHRDHAHRAARARGRARRWPAAGRRRRTCRSSACGRRTPPSPCSGGRARRSTRISPASARPSSASRNSSTNLMRAHSSGQRDAGVHEQRVARRDRRRRARSRPCCCSPSGVDAERQAALAPSTRTHAHRRRPRREQVMQWPSEAGSRASLDHARLQLLELLLVVGAHALEQLERRARLLLVDLARARSRRG